jgi:hypothetical protein
MPTYSVDALPREIQVLFEHAHAGDITPADFCKALDQHGVPGSLKMLYTRDAFGLPLEKAKEIVIQNEYGSLESWGKEMGDAIEGLSADSERKHK